MKWKVLLINSVFLGISGTSPLARTVATELAPTAAGMVTVSSLDSKAATKAPSAASSPALLEQIDPYLDKGSDDSDAMAQVTSISQLSDIQSTDWAYVALRRVVEKYGCLQGYLDSTYRGNRALSRYEFAVGLNACLKQIEALIAKQPDSVSRQDFEALQRLSEEFRTELATLGTRVDNLEYRTAFLESHQFSTTTKLDGEVILAVTGATSGNRNIRNSNTTPGVFPSGDLNSVSKVNPTVVARARLNFSTSFNGQDLLYTQLQTGNGGQTAGVLGQDPGLGGNVRFNTFDLDYSGAGPGVALNYLFYKFPLFTKDLVVTLGPVDAVNNYVDINRYAQDEATSFSSTFFKNNPLLFPVPGGSVASLSWNPARGVFSLHAVYAAGTAAPAPLSQPSAQAISQLFGEPNEKIVELEFTPKKGDKPGPFTVRLQYMNALVQQRNFSIGGVNAELAVTPKLGLFGRYGFGSIHGRVPGSFEGFANTNFTDTTLNPSSWQAGIGFLGLFIPGSRGAIGVGQPFVENHVGNSTQTNVEAFYRIPINGNIAVTPDIQFIFNPNNNSANSTITIGTLRTVFTF